MNRDGELGGIIALYFNGATCTFKELPPADDKKAMDEVYAYLDAIEKQRGKPLLFMLFNNLKQRIVKYGKHSHDIRKKWNWKKYFTKNT